MKKIILGVFALSLVSVSTLAITGGKKKSRKANTECTRNCTDSKECRKTAKCPNKPGCVCE
jgi:hypothetical protein